MDLLGLISTVLYLQKWPEEVFLLNNSNVSYRTNEYQRKNTVNHLLNKPKLARLNPHPVCFF